MFNVISRNDFKNPNFSLKIFRSFTLQIKKQNFSLKNAFTKGAIRRLTQGFSMEILEDI